VLAQLGRRLQRAALGHRRGQRRRVQRVHQRAGGARHCHRLVDRHAALGDRLQRRPVCRHGVAQLRRGGGEQLQRVHERRRRQRQRRGGVGHPAVERGAKAREQRLDGGAGRRLRAHRGAKHCRVRGGGAVGHQRRHRAQNQLDALGALRRVARQLLQRRLDDADNVGVQFVALAARRRALARDVSVAARARRLGVRQQIEHAPHQLLRIADQLLEHLARILGLVVGGRRRHGGERHRREQHHRELQRRARARHVVGAERHQRQLGKRRQKAPQLADAEQRARVDQRVRDETERNRRLVRVGVGRERHQRTLVHLRQHKIGRQIRERANRVHGVLLLAHATRVQRLARHAQQQRHEAAHHRRPLKRRHRRIAQQATLGRNVRQRARVVVVVDARVLLVVVAVVCDLDIAFALVLFVFASIGDLVFVLRCSRSGGGGGSSSSSSTGRGGSRCSGFGALTRTPTSQATRDLHHEQRGARGVPTAVGRMRVAVDGGEEARDAVDERVGARRDGVGEPLGKRDAGGLGLQPVECADEKALLVALEAVGGAGEHDVEPLQHDVAHGADLRVGPLQRVGVRARAARQQPHPARVPLGHVDHGGPEAKDERHELRIERHGGAHRREGEQHHLSVKGARVANTAGQLTLETREHCAPTVAAIGVGELFVEKEATRHFGEHKEIDKEACINAVERRGGEARLGERAQTVQQQRPRQAKRPRFLDNGGIAREHEFQHNGQETRRSQRHSGVAGVGAARGAKERGRKNGAIFVEFEPQFQRTVKFEARRGAAHRRHQCRDTAARCRDVAAAVEPICNLRQLRVDRLHIQLAARAQLAALGRRQQAMFFLQTIHRCCKRWLTSRWAPA
jgi:hypothetical protein